MPRCPTADNAMSAYMVVKRLNLKAGEIQGRCGVSARHDISECGIGTRLPWSKSQTMSLCTVVFVVVKDKQITEKHVTKVLI